MMARITIEDLPVQEEMKDEELKGIFGGILIARQPRRVQRMSLSAATLFGNTAPFSGGTILGNTANITGGTIVGATVAITGGRIK